LAEGAEPENLDKEVVRLVYAQRGYRGDGEPPPLDRELAIIAAGVYQEAFAALTGAPLVPGEYPAGPRVVESIRAAAR
jgi:phosphoribosylaminoimidazole-succinocarboxamide synthase